MKLSRFLLLVTVFSGSPLYADPHKAAIASAHPLATAAEIGRAHV